ncbi:hypothetical protein NDA11_000301 [Ustilago hordei]|nr:hypothetical protein NDA11_000301 [Ustilago hordei]
MRNPLSLHSGLGSLLFLSLVPVALSLPTGPNYGWSPYGFQSRTPNQWPPSSLQSVVTQQGPNVPQHGLPQQHLSSFGNAPQLAQNPPGFSSTSRILPDNEWGRFALDSALQGPPRRESLIPPPLPPSHAGWYPSSSEARGFLEPGPSYNHAVELRQNAGALQRQDEPDVPPHGSAATAMHNRVSKKRASSSLKIYTTPDEVNEYAKIMQKKVQEPKSLNSFHYSASPLKYVAPIGKDVAPIKQQRRFTQFREVKNPTIFNDINTKIFGGKLEKVDVSELDPRIWTDEKRAVHQPSRVLPYVTLKSQGLEGGADGIDKVRMTVHRLRLQRKKATGNKLSGKTLYNFWGFLEHEQLDLRKTVVHYGMGYVKPTHFEAVDKHIEAITQEAVAAAHVH